ncbi:hypothetical protein B0T17DRAFT_619923 [Bombardia bombarda]|uniref:Uncharacterized protein n=1 Tax=Bombardia bombarda TaxID=252184 RepID=A0AA39WGS3_9PEZI|nr:hypothetical protein B0T17DRAFT_619923 [Bombardia bombarda]
MVSLAGRKAMSQIDTIKVLHSDLARRDKMHGHTIDKMWRSFDNKTRASCMTAGARNGEVLRHSEDQSMGTVCYSIPEWNIQELANSGPDFMLDMLKHRATTTLFEQYAQGVNGRLGDHGLICKFVRERQVMSKLAYKDEYTFFTDDEKYGNSVKFTEGHQDECLAAFAMPIEHGICVPRSIGEMILSRQFFILQCLIVLIDDILDQGSTTRLNRDPPKAAGTTPYLKAVNSPLAIVPHTKQNIQLVLPDLIATARDQKAALDEFLGLLSTEPEVLTNAVNIYFYSQLELIIDEKGRRCPVYTDSYVSGAFFEVLHNAIKRAAIWDYLGRLLKVLDRPDIDKLYRPILLQEISNICHLEYSRALAFVKRNVATAMGDKSFKRLSSVYEKDGSPRVNCKGDPDQHFRTNAQLCYILHLCEAQSDMSKAFHWLKKLTDLHNAHPEEREKLEGREAHSLCDLAVIIMLIQDLSSVTSIPAPSKKMGQTFVTRSQDLDAELNKLKTQVDLQDFAVPLDNLLEPGMAEGALKCLDEFVVDKAGTKMGFLYQDLVEDCLTDLEKQLEQAKAKAKAQKEKTKWVPLPIPAPQAPEKRVEERKKKEKTRPSQSSEYEMIALSVLELSLADEDRPAPSARRFRVSASTAEVFSKLFSKASSRGTVPWVAFEAAMAEVGFSVVPKYGSVYTFDPAASLGLMQSLTVHRPHMSKLEGHLIPVFAQRLKRVIVSMEQTATTREEKTETAKRPIKDRLRAIWVFKFGMRLLSAVFCIAIIGVGGSLAATHWANYLPFAILAPPIFVTLVWDVIDGLCLLASAGHKGLHPGFSVGFDLVIWMALTVAAIILWLLGFSVDFYSTIDMDKFYAYANDSNASTAELYALLQGLVDKGLAILVLSAILIIFHFAIFVTACVQTNTLNLQKAPRLGYERLVHQQQGSRFHLIMLHRRHSRSQVNCHRCVYDDLDEIASFKDGN